MNTETTYQEITNEEKQSFTDKMTGVITEPSKMFAQLAEEKPTFLNWLFPILTLIIAAGVMSYLTMQNPVIRDQAILKQMERIEVSMNNAVEAGQITREQADAQMESIREQIEQQIESGTVTSAIAIFVITFVMFFIVAGILFLLARFALKGEGSYSSAMSAYGLSYFILALQVILMLIYSLATDQLINATSVAYFFDADIKTLSGYLLNKIDPFTIWFYSVVSIGMAKMFKSKTVGKYFAAVFGLWIGFSLLFFLAAQQFPLLQMFIQ